VQIVVDTNVFINSIGKISFFVRATLNELLEWNMHREEASPESMKVLLLKHDTTLLF